MIGLSKQADVRTRNRIARNYLQNTLLEVVSDPVVTYFRAQIRCYPCTRRRTIPRPRISRESKPFIAIKAAKPGIQGRPSAGRPTSGEPGEL